MGGLAFALFEQYSKKWYNAVNTKTCSVKKQLAECVPRKRHNFSGYNNQLKRRERNAFD
jgi:hypothetical protein